MKGYKESFWGPYWFLKIVLCLAVVCCCSSHQAEAAVITYYYSEHCELCKAFEPAWNEFAANEADHHIIRKKSTMAADNLQELTQLSQTVRERVSPVTPSIYIEFAQIPPVLLLGSKEVGLLYQVLEPGTAKTLNFAVPAQPAIQSRLAVLWPVTFAAAADAVNPCAIFVFILAVSYASVYSGRRKAILYGGIFTAALYAAYFTAGLAGKMVIDTIFSNANTVARLMSASLLLIAGFHVRTALFPQKTAFSELSDSAKGKLIRYAENCISTGGAAAAGILCAMIELPCTGGPYAFALAILAKQSTAATAMWLAYYNLIFISPVIVLLGILAISPEHIARFELMRIKYRRLLHVVMAGCLLAAGTWGLWHYHGGEL